MTTTRNQTIPYGRAICYSGYRQGQAPGQKYPSVDQIREDLLLLSGPWDYIRLYDGSIHGQRVLEVIKNEGLPLKVMLGTDLGPEVNNPQCPWGRELSDEELANNRGRNDANLAQSIELSRQYEDIVFSLSIGNEASVFWNDHMVPVERLVSMAKGAKNQVNQLITFCENYVPWNGKLEPLAEELDILSVHSYPLWEYKSIDEALDYTKENFYSVANSYPNKTVVITEAGWATGSNGRGMDQGSANETNQARYIEQLLSWADQNKVITFVFEAFDEPWKGSPDPREPEKHWGLYRVDRSPKAVIDTLYR